VTLVHAATRGSTRQHLSRTVLALSLVLNLFFVVGALWIRIHAPAPPVTPEQRFQQMAGEIGLDAQQKQAFAHYSQTMRQRLDAMRESVGPLVADAWTEVARPQADETKVMHLLDEAAQQRRAFVGQLTTTTLSFLATLSPDQRAKFVELARQRPRPWTPPPHHGASR
jgi:uncharacterized membrane protein